MTTFTATPGARCIHRRYPSFGTGIVTELLPSRFPSIPAKRCRVMFQGVTRACYVDDLAEPEAARVGGRATQLHVVDGGSAA